MNRELVIRDYYPEDSIMTDTIYFGSNGVLENYHPWEGLEFLYRSDSVLSRVSPIPNDTFPVSNISYLQILNTYEIKIENRSIRAYEYLSIYKLNGGEFDTKGVYIENLGSIYFRGYHNSVIINLQNANSPSRKWLTRKNIDFINSFLEDSILNVAPLPKLSQEDIDEEIGEFLELNFEISSCDIDKEFKAKFNKNLKVLENFATVDFGTEELEDVLSAVSYIGAVTEIPSQIYLGDAALYGSKEFKHDRKKWMKWYENNKCTMSLEKADSLYQVNVHLRPDHNPSN